MLDLPSGKTPEYEFELVYSPFAEIAETTVMGTVNEVLIKVNKLLHL